MESKIGKENNSVVDVTVLFFMLDVTTVDDRSVIEDITALSYFNRITEPFKSGAVILLRIVCAVLLVIS